MSEEQNIFDQPVKNAVKKAFENLRLVKEMIARLVAYQIIIILKNNINDSNRFK